MGAVEFDEYAVVARNIDPAADNKIHDDDVAQSWGFTGALVPGVELFAYATAPLVAVWGLAWLTGGRLTLRFRRPVYDGEQITVTGQLNEFRIVGPDGTDRALGTATPPASKATTRRMLPDAELPGQLRALSAVAAGPMGTIEMTGSAADNQAYLDAVTEPSGLFRTDAVAHPGALLRLVNLALMRNVDLGPWIHTATDCQFLAPARLPATLQVRSEVTETFLRNGSSYVRYDALVLADGLPVADVVQTAIYQLAAPPARD